MALSCFPGHLDSPNPFSTGQALGLKGVSSCGVPEDKTQSWMAGVLQAVRSTSNPSYQPWDQGWKTSLDLISLLTSAGCHKEFR